MSQRSHPTRERLQQALIDLLSDHSYETLTIQEIVDRARIGRTTFYLHYRSKGELLLGCHEAMIDQFQMGPQHSSSREALLASEAPAGTALAYRHLAAARGLLYPVLRGKDGVLFLRQIRDRNARAIEASLKSAFGEADSRIPFGVLANYLAGAQIALVQWWLEKRQPYAPEDLAQTSHRLQRAAICEAFGLRVEG